MDNLYSTFAQLFGSIIDYRAQKKQAIVSYLQAIEQFKLDPTVIRAQWDLLNSEYDRLSAMDKELSDILQTGVANDQDIMGSYQRGLGTLVTASQYGAAEAAVAETELQLGVYEARQNASSTNRGLDQKDRELDQEDAKTWRTEVDRGKDKANSLSSEITSIKSMASSAVAGPAAIDALLQNVDTKYESLLSQDLPPATLLEIKYQRDRDKQDILNTLSENDSVINNSASLAKVKELSPAVASSLSGIEARRAEDKQRYNTKQNTTGQQPESIPVPRVPGISALSRDAISNAVEQYKPPTLLQRLGIDETRYGGDIERIRGTENRLLQRAADNKVYASHPELFTGQVDELGNRIAVAGKEKLVTDYLNRERANYGVLSAEQLAEGKRPSPIVDVGEVKFYLNDVTVNRQAEANTLRSSLETRRADLQQRTTNPDIATPQEIENKATVAFYEMFGTPKQREQIRQFNTGAQAMSTIPALRSNETTPEAIRDRDLIISGRRLSSAVDTARQINPTTRAEGLSEYNEDINTDVNNERRAFTYANRPSSGKSVISVNQATVDELSAAGLAIQDPDTQNWYIPGNGIKPDIYLETDTVGPLEDKGSESSEGGGTEMESASYLARGTREVTDALSGITNSVAQTKYSPEELNKYAGKKYSELTPQEQKYLDDASEYITKEFDKVMKQPISEKRDQLLEDLSISAQILYDVDDVNDKENEDITASINNYFKQLDVKKPQEVFGFVTEHKKKIEKEKIIIPKQAEKEVKAKGFIQGARRASDIYRQSVDSDNTVSIDTNFSAIPKEKVNAIKFIATAPKVPVGKDLDIALQKIFGKEWDKQSTRERAYEIFATYDMLK